WYSWILSQEMRAFTSSVYCTRTPATLRPVEPVAGEVCASNTITVNPCSLRRNAQDAPMMPAPMINTSDFTFIDLLPAYLQGLSNRLQHLLAFMVARILFIALISLGNRA